jgi:hypothetical protein
MEQAHPTTGYKRQRGAGSSSQDFKFHQTWAPYSKQESTHGMDSKRMGGILTGGNNVIGEIDPKGI